jgi:transcriptional regulator with XRE-family HTH domain/tetratricopeptide (TPR) repeat protein
VRIRQGIQGGYKMINGEMNDIVSFGGWVRQRRKVLDLTQAALAKQVGCAVVTIKKIEQDERRPSRQMAQLLADQLAIPNSVRDDFIKMGRGQFVPSISSPQEALRPPAFLQHIAPSIKQDQPPFVARERELAQLDGHLETTLAGNGQVVFILGEAGRGKTRLMAEFARRAQETHLDLVVAVGHCNAQAGSGDPYLPFRDVLNMLTGDLEARWIAGNISPEQVLRLWALLPHTIQAITERGPTLIDLLVLGMPLVRRIIPYIPHQVDWLEKFQTLLEQQKTQPANLEQSQLLEEVTQVLRALATRQPLLLLLDDLQWVDDASKNLLFHLGRRLAGSRILILGAYRPSEIALGRPTGSPGQTEQHPLEPVINEFKRYFGNIQLDLGRFVPSEGRAFVDAFLDSEPNRLGEVFRENLFQHTKGHPLFTVEMLRNMQENGNLIQDEAGQWIESAASAAYKLPARVEAVIEQRINRLDETLQDILTLASVEGELFTVQVAACILEIDERQVLHRLTRDLEQRHRLVREHSEERVDQQRLNRYQFGHVLFQEYLYHRLGPGEQRLYHREVAEALEAIFETHTREIITTLLHQSAKIGEVLERPYPDCLARFGPSLVHHFWRGQEWAKAAGYAMCVGTAAMKTYALREAIEYYERALEALDKVPHPPPELTYEAAIRWVEAAFKFRPYPEQLRRLGRAETIARDLNDKPRLIRALHWTANVHLARGLWMRAGTALMECLALAEELGNEKLSVRPAYFKALMTTLVNPRGALALLERALELTRKYEDRHVEALTLGTKAQMHAQLGEFGLARETMQQTCEALQHTDSPLTESDVDLLTAWTYLAMGDAQHGLEYGERSVEKAIATDNMDCICYGFDCVGFSNLEMQRIAEATLAFKEAIERSETSGAIIPKLLGQAGLAMSQFCNGHVEAIQDLETALVEMQGYNNHVGAANAAQMLGTCLIQSGDPKRAEIYLNMARDFYRRAEMRPYLVRTLSSLAQLFEKQERSVEAQDIQAQIETLTQALTA